MQNMLEKIQTISTIPTLPTVIAKIAKLLQSPQTSAEEVGRAITTDQSLASKVLKLVNSAFYGFPGKISTITHAIVILGFSTVKNIVLTASIFDAFKNRKTVVSDFNFEKFWLHSIACGAAAQAIARHIGCKEKEECFIAGLIHDIGKIIECQYLPAEFMQVVAHVKEKNCLFYDAEKELFKTTHQEIGGFLAQRWNLPENLQNAIKYHHIPSPARSAYTVTAIVHTADILVRALDFGSGGDARIPLISDEAWKELKLEGVVLQALFETISDEVEKATVFMQLASGE